MAKTTLGGYRYELVYKGVFGRNRNPKLKIVRLGAFTTTAKPLAELMPLAKEALAALKPKGPHYWAVVEQPMELETWEDGERTYEVELTVCFSSKTLYNEAA